MKLSKRIGRTRRQIDVPLCRQCAAELKKRSAAEERWQKLSWPLTAAVSALLFFAVLLFASGTVLWLRLPLALLLSVVVAVIVIRLFRIVIAAAALPEKKAILESARLQAFSHRRATFLFSNDTFVEHFVEINRPLLPEL